MMAAGSGEDTYHRVGRMLGAVCNAIAMIGGAFMVAAMLVLVVHVIGNGIGRPILGVNEIVSELVGVSIFCFLPICHFQGGNIVVDFFSKPFPEWLRKASDIVVLLAFAGVAALLTWRLGAGGISAFERGKQSMFLSLPEWPGYLVAFVACVVWVVIIFFTVWSAVRGAPEAAGAEERPFNG